ncbi:amidohydrolase [Nakamurella lactea]|uniref:amidohydrolase n=1 Tax=Nakamurella lactea TaxID=459515 RepID=UPI0003F52E16|nr:amidohydrolase [Nakamurella lactea]
MIDEGNLQDRAAHEMSRRKMLQVLGVGAGATAAAALSGDPVYAATQGFDDRLGVTAATYAPPTKVAKPSSAKDIALDWIDGSRSSITDLSDQIWEFAELSLREWDSSLATADLLRSHGFTIRWGTAGLPTAFVATYSQGHGGPTLGFNAECDALPGLSQKKGVPIHDPLNYNYDAYGPTYGPGHGDAHNTLGAASVGAAIAVSKAIKKKRLNATIKVFSSAGEEQLVGKAYAVKAGAYRDLDAFLDWHPTSVTSTGWGTNSALLSATFTFLGSAGHGGSPLGNKSGLDGALLMATMTEFLREKNVAASGRFHYAVINGGGAPNVTPDMCSIWYYVREGSPARVNVLYGKILACAQAAASASQTTLQYRMNSAIWNTLGNKAGAELMYDNMQQIGPTEFTAADQTLAKAVQASLGKPQVGMNSTIFPLTPPNPTFLGGASSDTADVSWQTPKISCVTPTWPPGTPNHNWAATATAATNIAHQALLSASRYLAGTAIDLITQPTVLAAIRQEFHDRTAGITWNSLIPDGTQPPIYQPPASFLRKTGQAWPPPGITWPVPSLISREKLGTDGPPLPPVT